MSSRITAFGMLAGAAFVWAGAVCCAQAAQAPVALENGRIQQGPFILFGDEAGGIHLMKGSDVLVRGMGMRCGNGGYWTASSMTDPQVELGRGRMAFRARVPGKDITYEHEVSIAGDRIRIAMRRTGDWGGDFWDGFDIWLPLAYYKGAQMRADGQVLTCPAEYSPETQSIASNVQRLECHLGDPSRNLVLESESGLSVSDTRRWGGMTYAVGFGPAREGPQAEAVMFLTLPQVPEMSEAAVRCSRIGYPVNGEKTAVLEWPKHTARPDDRLRLERADGSVVREGRFAPTVEPEYAQCGFAVFDFTDVREPGDYRLAWAGGTVEFPIRESVFTDALWTPTLDYFVPWQMCHADVDLNLGVLGHRKCHMDDAQRVPAHFGGVDGFRSYECEGTPYEAGEHIPRAKGGWHDAGDCDVNINTTGFSTWMLSLAYEEFGIERDVATLDVDAQTFTAGRPDGTPDVVQQVEWGATWLLSMLQPDGRTFVGVVAQPDRYSLGGKKWSEATDNVPNTGDERHLYVDYHADLQLMQATALCAAGRVLRASNPPLADQCLDAARKAMHYFNTHEEVYRKTVFFYPDREGRDGGVAAALAELYMTTHDPQYLQALQDMTEAIRNLNLNFPAVYNTGASSYWYAPPVLARLYPDLPEGDLKAAVLEVCRKAAQMQADHAAPRPWPFHGWHFGKWGNTGSVGDRMFDAYWLERVAPDVFSLDGTVSSALWIFGLHPLNDLVFVSGLGYPAPEDLHSGQINALFGTEPGTVPGALVPGINGIFPYTRHNVLYYRDDGNAGNNEACIAVSATYIFGINALKKAGY